MWKLFMQESCGLIKITILICVLRMLLSFNFSLQQPTLSDMTMYELNFSLLVEQMLSKVEPTYRQIVVEVCYYLHTVKMRPHNCSCGRWLYTVIFIWPWKLYILAEWNQSGTIISPLLNWLDLRMNNYITCIFIGEGFNFQPLFSPTWCTHLHFNFVVIELLVSGY